MGKIYNTLTNYPEIFIRDTNIINLVPRSFLLKVTRILILITI